MLDFTLKNKKRSHVGSVYVCILYKRPLNGKRGGPPAGGPLGVNMLGIFSRGCRCRSAFVPRLLNNSVPFYLSHAPCTSCLLWPFGGTTQFFFFTRPVKRQPFALESPDYCVQVQFAQLGGAVKSCPPTPPSLLFRVAGSYAMIWNCESLLR